jgi:hypothetical protein
MLSAIVAAAAYQPAPCLVTILNLKCHAKSKVLDHVAFVPDCVEIRKPPVCWLWHIARNAYTSISLLLLLLFLLPQGCLNTHRK